ncbi:MAG: response regulator transcription factor [Acidobacteria bacterium]|nr:response regulator transcription factor [Acidobacteriota bacterium]MCB9397986.1 response regulator transcription factor [Acidobacteriota bacterium]
MKLLVVEDSERLQRSLFTGLSQEGFAVDLARTAEEALDLVQTYTYDVIILDIMLPGMDGFGFLQRLRSQNNQTHVLILSAKDDVQDRVKGLVWGADDYLTKPFVFGELVARIRALLRRLHQNKCPVLKIGDLRLDLALRQVSRQGQVLDLSAKEFSILEYLALNRGRVVTRDQLADHLYQSGCESSSNVIDVLVYRIRKKINLPAEDPVIETKRGFGYVIA